MAIAEDIAHRSVVLGFDQSVIVCLAGAGLGLLDAEYLKSSGHRAVGVAGAIVGVNTFDYE